jgi:hypothetical protein
VWNTTQKKIVLAVIVFVMLWAFWMMGLIPPPE